MESKASIIIRCKNEEDWIGHCLSAVKQQNYPHFEIVIVDSGSTDKTLEIAESLGVDRIVRIENYKPGLALNEGIGASDGEYIVMLSAHCVPKDASWLVNLLASFDNPEVVGVYGRQLPVAFSSASDTRDLLITFGRDKRIQEKDYFFHNANSAVSRAVWEAFPFDDTAPNIEDRIWGKQVTAAGHKLAYEPAAEVYHYHGIHHNRSDARATSTLQVLKAVDGLDGVDSLPVSLRPEHRDIIALIPVTASHLSFCGREPISMLVDELAASSFVKHIYLIAEMALVKHLFRAEKISFLERPEKLAKPAVSLGQVMQWGITKVNESGRFPDYVIYANPEYLFRPEKIINTLVEEACYKGLDSVFVGYPEYSSFWNFEPENQQYRQLGENLSPRNQKDPMYKSLFGIGCISKSRIIRQGSIVGDENIGIIASDDFKQTLRITDSSMQHLIEAELESQNSHR